MEELHLSHKNRWVGGTKDPYGSEAMYRPGQGGGRGEGEEEGIGHGGRGEEGAGGVREKGIGIFGSQGISRDSLARNDLGIK